MSHRYRVPDEPPPSPWAAFAVQPFWALFSIMWASTLVSYVWFAINSVALGSATRTRELKTLGAGLAVVTIYTQLLVMLIEVGLVEKPAVPYLVLVIVAVKLGVAYHVHTLQERACELFTYFGGEPKPAGRVVFVLGIVSSFVLALLPPFWRVVLG